VSSGTRMSRTSRVTAMAMTASLSAVTLLGSRSARAGLRRDFSVMTPLGVDLLAAARSPSFRLKILKDPQSLLSAAPRCAGQIVLTYFAYADIAGVGIIAPRAHGLYQQ
jgi:hypothetical protein